MNHTSAMSSYFAFVIKKILSVQICIVCFNVALGQNVEDVNKVNRQLFEIRTKIELKHDFAPSDRQFTLKAVESKSMSTRHAAIGVLGLASQEHLFPQVSAEKLIESKASQTSDSESVIYLQEYEVLVGLKKKPAERASDELQAILSERKNRGKLDEEEWTFIRKQLSDPQLENKLLAAKLAIQKHGLNSKDLIALLSKFRVEQNSHGVSNKCWGFVIKVIKARNGG